MLTFVMDIVLVMMMMTMVMMMVMVILCWISVDTFEASRRLVNPPSRPLIHRAQYDTHS